MNLIFIATCALLFVLGALIKYKKATWLISGYNTASKEKKAEYDVDKLCHHMGNFVFLTAYVWSAITLLIIIFVKHSELIIFIGSGVLIAVIIGGIIYLNTNNRVRK